MSGKREGDNQKSKVYVKLGDQGDTLVMSGCGLEGVSSSDSIVIGSFKGMANVGLADADPDAWDNRLANKAACASTVDGCIIG